jgi:hypothetical protein
MDYFKTLAEIEVEKSVAGEIAQLSDLKKVSDESILIPKNKILMDYFATEINHFEEKLKLMTFKKNQDYEYADTVFRKIIEMVWSNE